MVAIHPSHIHHKGDFFFFFFVSELLYSSAYFSYRNWERKNGIICSPSHTPNKIGSFLVITDLDDITQPLVLEKLRVKPVESGLYLVISL